MSERLNAAILATLKNATGQKPTPIGEVLRRVLSDLPDATPDQVHDALEHLHTGRALNRARIIRADIDHEVWWPTCVAPRAADIRDITIRQHTRADAARAASQHQQDLAMSKKPVTKTDQLLKCLAEHGPLYANQLAEKTGLQTRNIDGNLVSSMRHGVIATRQGYVPERRRHMKHYMTQDQAAAWDARQQTPTADIPSEDQADPSPEASAADCHGGGLALLLIDGLDETEIEYLDSTDPRHAQARAMDAIDRGHAARVVVVRILGEAQRRSEWREAA